MAKKEALYKQTALVKAANSIKGDMVAVKKACVSNGKENIDTKKRRQLVDKN